MEFSRTIRIGIRKSPLALKQVEEVLAYLREFYPGTKEEIIGIDTYGDKDRLTPISEIEGTDFFTREIDDALLKGEIDFAVHSAKDLPENIAEGLYIAAVTQSIDPSDALVSKGNLKINQLPIGAKVGASSARRKEQLKAFRNDLRIINIRGNIQERLKKLDENNLDAVVIASCALIRLGLEGMIIERIPLDILRPHPLQGCLAALTRREDPGLIKLLAAIDTRETVTI